MKTTLIQHFCALVCAAYVSAAAAPTITVTLDSVSGGPGKFAADEIRREAAARGLTVVSAEANAPAWAVVTTLTAGAAAPRAAAQQGLPC